MASDKHRSALHGAIAGIASRTVIAPLDVIKIRLQVQNKFYPHYLSIPDAFIKIFKEEGPFAFWKGNGSGLLLYGSYGAIQFYSYNQLHSIFTSKFAKGATAALIATVLTYPFDTLRIRFAMRNNQTAAIQMFQDIVVREGLTFGLFKGLLPTLLQVVPYMGTVFAGFEASKTIMPQDFPQPIADFVAGAIGGAFGKAITMPFDVLRKRMQIQNDQFNQYELKNLQRFQSIKHCIAHTWINEGIRGFYKGLSIAIFKAVPASATTFAVYGFLDRL